MHLSETEIVIPFKYKSNLKRSFLIHCGLAVYFIIAPSLFVINGTLGRAFSQVPAVRTHAQNTLIDMLVVFSLAIVLYSVSLMFLIRQLRAPSPDVRITHEGIFTSHDSFLITWAEIEELSLATWMGSPYLRIVPRNLEAVAARAKASSRPWRRFAIDATLTFFPSTTSPAPLGLSQRALPISIRDLLMAIQERFGTQLHEHHILIRGAQHGAADGSLMLG